ncbi:MAG TPA: HRDC domain-containing protein [Candidatus Methylacidiphilales bacterium]|nr:HRDC domain-containing protein [Candidatus Methylacidiphilales bacterium]
MGDTYLWIDQPDSLARLVEHLRDDTPIAIDTEADSLHHYRESVCLVQLTQRGEHFLLDPFAKLDLTDLWARLHNTVWVLQGADFDLRMLRRLGAREPAAVFDTMLAGQLLGLPAVGYAALVERYFGIVLCKKNQKADWSRRPLSQSMLEYAMQDTQHLEPLAARQQEDLIAAGRLEWHRQSCARVVRLSLIQRGGDEDAWRISGSNKLSPGALAVLRRVWEWREGEAERMDRPTFKVYANEALLSLAIWADAHRRLPPYAWAHWPHHMRQGGSTRLATAVEQGREDSPMSRLSSGSRPQPNPAADQRLEKLRVKREEVAAREKLDPSLIAAKSILTTIAHNPDAGATQLIQQDRWCPWQAELMEVPYDPPVTDAVTVAHPLEAPVPFATEPFATE